MENETNEVVVANNSTLDAVKEGAIKAVFTVAAAVAAHLIVKKLEEKRAKKSVAVVTPITPDL